MVMIQDEPVATSFIMVSILTVQAVGRVVSISFVGYLASRLGILSGEKHISKLNVTIFTPCLIFSQLAKDLSLSRILEFSVIPIFYVVSILMAYVFAQITSKCFHLNKKQGNFVTAMSVFGSNSLPISLSMVLATTLPNLLWDHIEDDNSTKVASRGIMYLMVYQQLDLILRWSWGYNSLLAKSDFHDSTTDSNENVEYQIISDEETPILMPIGASTKSVDLQTTLGGVQEEGKLKGYGAISDKTSKEITYEQSPLLRLLRYIPSFMNAPLWSMLVSLIVVVIKPLHYQLFENDGFIKNTITSSIDDLGKLSIPLILLVLGSNLASQNEREHEHIQSQKYNHIVIASILSRMILPFLFLLPLFVYLTMAGHGVSRDPIFLVITFIIAVSPPAMQLSQICQLNGVFEKEMAGVLFWGYVVLMLPTTIIVVIAGLNVLSWI